MAAYNRKHSVGLAYAHKYEGVQKAKPDARHLFKEKSISQISDNVIQSLHPSAVKKLKSLERNGNQI